MLYVPSKSSLKMKRFIFRICLTWMNLHIPTKQRNLGGYNINVSRGWLSNSEESRASPLAIQPLLKVTRKLQRERSAYITPPPRYKPPLISQVVILRRCVRDERFPKDTKEMHIYTNIGCIQSNCRISMDYDAGYTIYSGDNDSQINYHYDIFN